MDCNKLYDVVSLVMVYHVTVCNCYLQLTQFVLNFFGMCSAMAEYTCWYDHQVVVAQQYSPYLYSTFTNTYNMYCTFTYTYSMYCTFTNTYNMYCTFTYTYSMYCTFTIPTAWLPTVPNHPGHSRIFPVVTCPGFNNSKPIMQNLIVSIQIIFRCVIIIHKKSLQFYLAV